MNTYQIQNHALTPRWASHLLVVAIGVLVASCGALPTWLHAADDGQTLFRKSCDSCGRTVGPAARRGQTCPHCGVYWTDERTTGGAIPVNLPDPSASAPSAHSRESVSLKPSSRKTWPQVPHQARGGHHLILDNHTSTDVWIGLRDGANGADMKVAAHGKGYLGLPEGTYRVYVFRNDQPTSLYEAKTIKIGGKRVIRSTQTFCLWFDEVESTDRIDPSSGLPTVAAR
jgi:hypothetical protein